MSFCGKNSRTTATTFCFYIEHNKIILTHFSNLDKFFTVAFKPSESDTSTCKIVPFTFSCRLG